MQLLLVCLLILPYPGAASTVMEALASSFDLITFRNFLRSTHLDTALEKGDNIVLVPTDRAFSRYPDSYMDMLHDTDADNPHVLSDLIKYHIIPYSGQMTTTWTGEKVQTLLNRPVRMITYDSIHKNIVNGVELKESNLTVSNGHIYLLDSVLSAPKANVSTSLLGDERFSAFLTAVTLAGMKDKLDEENVTVFAPTNDAFLDLTQQHFNKLFGNHAYLQEFISTYIIHGIYFTVELAHTNHIDATRIKSCNVKIYPRVNGAKYLHITPGKSEVTQPDWLATNGVIHGMSHLIYTPKRCSDWIK